MTASTPVPSDPAGGRAGLRGRLIEAAAQQIALAANEGRDWPVRDEDRHDARAVLAAVLPLLADEMLTLAPPVVFTERGQGRRQTATDAAALLRSLTEEQQG